MKTYVHCKAGRSRSATLVAAYIIDRLGTVYVKSNEQTLFMVLCTVVKSNEQKLFMAKIKLLNFTLFHYPFNPQI